MNRLRPTLRGPHQRGERPAGMTPPRAPGAGRNAENIDKMLGKPESGSADRLPHERDQHLEEQRSAPRSDVEQAARDIESGQLDTDLHNTPGIERVVRERCTANREDHDRQVANRSADELADKRGDAGKPAHSHAHQR